jgi:hypothetical protein
VKTYIEEFFTIFSGFHQTNFSFLTAYSLQQLFSQLIAHSNFFHSHSPTKQTLNSAGNHHQHKLQRPDGRITGQSSVHSRDAISPHPSPASGRNSRPRWIHASPEGLLKQRAHLRLARGPVRAGFAVKQPWSDCLANRPYRRSIQCKDRLTPYPDARSSVDKAEVTAVTRPSTD